MFINISASSLGILEQTVVGGLMGVFWLFFFFCSVKPVLPRTAFLFFSGFKLSFSAFPGFLFLAVPSFQNAPPVLRNSQVSREPFSWLDTTYLSERDGVTFLTFVVLIKMFFV